MKNDLKAAPGFSVVELLVVVALLVVFASLLLPALALAKAKAQRTTCMNNVRQINSGVRMYSDDASDVSPSPRGRPYQLRKPLFGLQAAHEELRRVESLVIAGGEVVCLPGGQVLP